MALAAAGPACVPYHNLPVEPAPGIFFTHHSGPLTTNVQHTPSGRDLIVAEDTTSYLLDILVTLGTFDFAWDDAAIGRIAKENGIDRIAFADYDFFSVFGVYSEFTVRVYGYGEGGSEQ